MRRTTKAEDAKIEMVNANLLEEFVKLRGDIKREDLAEILDYHPSTAMRLEKGTYKLTLKMYLKLCYIYDVDPALLLQKMVLTAK